EVAAAMPHEGVELLEGAGVEQEVHALARGQLPLLVLGLDSRRAAALEDLASQGLQPLDRVHGHRASWGKGAVLPQARGPSAPERRGALAPGARIGHDR